MVLFVRKYEKFVYAIGTRNFQKLKDFDRLTYYLYRRQYRQYRKIMANDIYLDFVAAQIDKDILEDVF